MFAWDLFVDVLRQLLFLLAHQFDGSLGTAILAVSLGARLMMLPLTFRAAIAARRQQQRLATLQPELDRLRSRHAGDALALAEATQALYRQHGISALPRGGLLTALVQIPLGAALYQAIMRGVATRQGFLWMADLARPDALLAGIVGALAALGAYTSSVSAPSTPGAQAGMSITTTVLVGGLLAAAFAVRMASGVGVYWAASSLVGVGQSLLVRRFESRRLSPSR